MKRLTLVLVCLLIALPVFGQTKWFDGSFEDAKTLAAKEGKLLLLDFTAGTT
jgi:hypothetical protein